ncbi:MAG: hypothetical protein KIT84_43220 [Labilithrix sp.]|nr:hypothetical protein [Labilithrix sp.]MCW5817889.1 hypothetical protein [Labilithrix sp.]
MKPWQLLWAPAALRDLHAVPHWRSAERIDEAVQRLAETGEGPTRRAAIEGRLEDILLVPPYFVVLSRVREDRTIVVWRIIRFA